MSDTPADLAAIGRHLPPPAPAPARGIAVGLALSLPIWAALAAAIWWL